MSPRILFAWVWALVICLLLTHCIYLWLGKRVAPDTDILALLPVQERDPLLQDAFVRMVDSAQQRLVVLVGTGDWTEAVRAADAYFAVLAPRTDLLQLDRVADQTRGDGLALFQQHRLVLLTPQDETALRSEPEKHWIDIALANLYAPFAGFQLGAWRDDPFGLFSRWVQARVQETPVRPRDGRLFVGDGQGQYVLMPFTLRVPAFSMTAQQEVIPLLAEARQAARKAVPQVEVMSCAYFRTKRAWARLSAPSTMRKDGSRQPPSPYFSPLISMTTCREVLNEKKRIGHRLESRYRESHCPTPRTGRLRYRAALSQPA